LPTGTDGFVIEAAKSPEAYEAEFHPIDSQLPKRRPTAGHQGPHTDSIHSAFLLHSGGFCRKNQLLRHGNIIPESVGGAPTVGLPVNSLAAARPVLRWILVGTAAIWVALELRQSITHRPEGVKANWGSEILFRLIIGVGALVAGLLSGVARSATVRPAAVADWIGLVLFWSGISLRLWSFHTLGRYFTFTVQTSRDQPVITDGPYRLIRHPSYAGLLLVILAVGLFIGNWLSLACLTAAIAGGLVYRIRVEERALLQSLGDGYRKYAETHKRLVPFIW
jgi:protein-S-isoprenylcysteine O-methyltransferase Ste14